MSASHTRTRDEVIGLVLEAAREGSSKTSIMYKSFVSFDKLEELLNHLIGNNLLEQEKGELTFKTTQKGIDLLNKLNCCGKGESRNTGFNHGDLDNNANFDQGSSYGLGSDLTTSSFNKIIVIGLGQLGLPVAKYVKGKGFDVYGYDISPKAIERAEKTAGIKEAVNFSGFDVYIICVSTHKQEDLFSPQIDGILSIVRDKISKEAKDGALVVIESTVPKGTSKKVFEMLNHRLHVAHAPHRWYALEEKEHGVNQLRVVGGVCDCCLRVAMQFYDGAGISISANSSTTSTTLTSSIKAEELTGNLISTTETPIGSIGDSLSDHTNNTDTNINIINGNDNISSNNNNINNNNNNSNDGIIKNTNLGIPMHPVPDVEIAELTKIVENAHRYLQIAFAEDLYLYCQANNINFAELRDSLNTKWNVNILEPRDGVGGHCLPKDTKMFLNSSKSIKSKIIEAAIQVDSEYRKYQAINELCHSNKKSMSTRAQDISQTGSKNIVESHSTSGPFLSLISAKSRLHNDIDIA
jgi:UDP-N-acetyl-D-mannosaminuronic acid dehydrogenase